MYENHTSSLPSPEPSHALDYIHEEASELLSEAFIFGDGHSLGPIGRHLTTNTLEQYALGLLVEAERDRVEEHLLICQSCTDKLERVDGVIALFKTVLIPATAETMIAVCH